VLVGLREDDVLSGAERPGGYEHGMVTFAAKADAADAGPVEWAYALMAKAAATPMPTTRLFVVTTVELHAATFAFDDSLRDLTGGVVTTGLRQPLAKVPSLHMATASW